MSTTATPVLFMSRSERNRRRRLLGDTTPVLVMPDSLEALENLNQLTSLIRPRVTDGFVRRLLGVDHGREYAFDPRRRMAEVRVESSDVASFRAAAAQLGFTVEDKKNKRLSSTT